MLQGVGRRVCVAGALAGSVLGIGAVGASEAVAACGVEGNIAVSRNGDGSRYVRGGGNGYCSPPAAANAVSVNVAPQNAVLALIAPGSSTSAVGSCNTGACSITPVGFAYTVPNNVLLQLVNPGPMCFTATFTALAGGGVSRTACG